MLSSNTPIRVLNVFMVLDRGGAETLVMNLYRNMDRTKIQFDFMVHGNQIGAYEEEILSLGGRIFRMPPYSLFNLFSYNKALKVFFKEHKEYRIVHAHNSELGNLVLRQAKIAGIPHRICHAHSAPHGVSIHNMLRNIFRWHTERYTTERMACSELAGHWQFGSKGHFTVIKNGIDLNQFTYDESLRLKTRDELGLKDKFVIGQVGRFVPTKNHTFLLKVFKFIVSSRDDAVLVLVGDGPLRKQMEQEAEALGLSDKVMFMGVREDVDALMNACDVFVFPSLFEGLGIVLVEAQATGLPCIISDAVPTQVSVTDLCHFLPLEKPEEWAKCILSLDAMKRKGRTEAAAKGGYDIRLSADFLTHLYQRMAND